MPRSCIPQTVENCPEAKAGLDACREDELTFEQAMMGTVKRLFLANQDLQHRLDHAK